MRDKHKLTTHLVGLLPVELDVSTEDALRSWWYNPRKDGGLRLTDEGYRILVENLYMDHYDYNVDPNDLTLKTILMLDQKLQHPYYILGTKKLPEKLVFFDSKDRKSVV